MTVLWLDTDPEKSARYHCDIHVEKKCLEYAKVLSTAAHFGGFHHPDKMTKPVEGRLGEVAQWVAESQTNYIRTLKMAKALSTEYRERYGIGHIASEKVIDKMNISEVKMPDNGFTEPPASVPDYCKKDSAVESYRAYYNHGIDRRLSWFGRNKPEWYTGDVAETTNPRTA